MGNKCQLNTYMWALLILLDISGQHLGAGCIVGVSVRPSGAVFGNINFVEIYICIEYMLPTIGGINVS